MKFASTGSTQQDVVYHLELSHTELCRMQSLFTLLHNTKHSSLNDNDEELMKSFVDNADEIRAIALNYYRMEK